MNSIIRTCGCHLHQRYSYAIIAPNPQGVHPLKALTLIDQVNFVLLDKSKPVSSKAYSRRKSQDRKRELPPRSCEFYYTRLTVMV